MKHLLHLKSAVLALVLTVTLLGKAHAQAWTPPTLEQIGAYYYEYLATVYSTGQVLVLPAGAAAAAVQGFGPNVVGYAVSLSDGQNTPFFFQALGQSQKGYYYYVGSLLGYQNYLNPAYAQQLESFYLSYGDQLASYYQSLSSFYQSYYTANASYFENLIF